jgi:cytochrome P450
LYHLIGDFIGAGADTIAISLLWTFAVLSQKPEVQEKIVKELDEWKEIHGQDQVPEFNEDRDNFPYTICVQKEIMRFRPTTNFGIPHVASEEGEEFYTVLEQNCDLLTPFFHK